MKAILVTKTGIDLSKVKFGNNLPDRKADTRDLIELTLDMVPQGGFTPKEIRERNRIQDAIDKSRKIESEEVELEDSDYEALLKIVSSSRWTSRDKELQSFLELFPIKD